MDSICIFKPQSFRPTSSKKQAMELTSTSTTSKLSIKQRTLPTTQAPAYPATTVSHFSSPYQISPKTKLKSFQKSTKEVTVPTMDEILAASKAQNLDLRLQTLGPFFRITARNLHTKSELGRAEGLIRVCLNGKILHLDSMRLKRETLGMEKSIFGIGLFIGAVAIRHGYDCGCSTAELLAINDSDLYHSKLVRFYTRIGFNAVHEVTGSTIGDFPHMLVWGGIGTRMDANIDELMIKWCTRFKNRDRLS